MKQFIKMLLVFSLAPLLGFILVENSVRDSVFKAKADYISQNKENIELMILGSSHNWRGLNPEYLDMVTAPLAHRGSALNIDYLLNKKFFPQFPKLKLLVLELSYHTLEDFRNKDWPRNHLFLYYYGINNFEDSPLLNKHLLIVSNPKEYIDKFFLDKIERNNGEFNKFGFIDFPIQSRFEKFKYDTITIKIKSQEYLDIIKNHQEESLKNYKKNIVFLDEIIKQSIDANIQVILISPPKYHLYNRIMKKEKLERRETFLEKYASNKNVHFWNFEKEYEYNAKYFGNENHLNPKGAQTFTKKINKKLNKIISNK